MIKNSKILKIAALALLLAATPANTFASPEYGDIFGYRLGDFYPLNDQSHIVWNSVPSVIIWRGGKDDPISRVEIKITAKTHQIVTIYGVTDYPNFEEAKLGAEAIADQLMEKYGGIKNPSIWKGEGHIRGANMWDHEIYRAIIGDKYHLGVYAYKGSTVRPPLMYVQLSFVDGSREAEYLKNKSQKEKMWAVTEKANARYRRMTQVR